MTVAEAIQKPTSTLIILAEITAGVWCRAWVVHATHTNSYTVAMPDEVTSVKCNRATSLTYRASAALVNSNAGSWYWDRATETLYVRPVSGSIFANVVQAFVTFYFANPTAKVLNDRFYDPRLISAPSLSQRIEAMFGNVAQIGGGSIVLADVDGYFATRQNYQWNAGSVVLKLGVDTPAGAMAWANYETGATWVVEDWERSENSFTLRLTEAKSRLKSKLPFTFFTRAAYPNIEEETTGKPIPIIYGTVFGAPATLIDPGLKEFKVCGHAIKEFSEVRIKKTFDEAKTRTVAADSWRLYSTAVWRYFLEDEEGSAVSYNGAGIPKADDLADCIATANRWWDEENFIYVHPDTGNTIASGTYVVQSVKQIEAWDNINFASRDLTDGTFTLGDDWTLGQPVSVDVKGKASGGALMENSIDIIEDILTTIGATNLDAASFTTASARLVLGTTITGRTRHTRSVGVVLREPREVIEILNEILEQIGAFLYSDELGQYTIGLFEPQPGEALAVLDDLHLTGFGDRNETKDIVSSVNSNFARRDQDDWQQNVINETVAIQHVNDQAEPVVKEMDLFFATERDAINYNNRTRIHQGTALRLWDLKCPWIHWLRSPGEQVRLTSDRFSIDEIAEIIERRVDIGAKTVSLKLGNLRGWGDAPGFWVADAAVLPTRFASLTGYAAGSLVWNAAWDDEIKAWARQNVGYWTDDNGFADSDDPDSFIPSAWI
jgi:hypothetical protein